MTIPPAADPSPIRPGQPDLLGDVLAAAGRPHEQRSDHASPAFALLHRRTPGQDTGTVEVLAGRTRQVARLAELPCGAPGGPATLALVPFRQITERGFAATDDGTPLSVLVPELSARHPLDEVLRRLPEDPAVRVADGGFDLADDTYADTVRRVLDEEIATGEGANFVIHRTYRGRIENYSALSGLTLFRRLLQAERGAYWTFVVHTGDRTLVGASPEAHVRMTGGSVTMNPISGTYRYPPQGPDLDGLLEFLDDRKETDELSMVLDEELKMMCRVAARGGTVIGPRLKEMSHLAHTEYELRGRTTLDAREVLRETMFAPTVTGSPVENACRVIRRWENGGRGYYAGALALLGRDEHGRQTLDSPILIRTADIDAATGEVRVPVGATLVRGSDPAAETAETHAKAAAVLAALRDDDVPAGPRPRNDPDQGAVESGPPVLAGHPRVRQALDARRERLAPFWLRMRTEPAAPERRADVLIVDGEDTFTAMLAHLFRAQGHLVAVRRFDAPGIQEAVASHQGPVVLGPGPGHPADLTDPRMRRLRALTARLLSSHQGGLLGICLGHELIAAEIGLDLRRLSRPRQGVQREIGLFGAPHTVGFYHSYTAVCDDDTATELAAHGVAVSRMAGSDEVNALRGPGFAGMQFHPESVLSVDGAALACQFLAEVAGQRRPADLGLSQAAGATGATGE